MTDILNDGSYCTISTVLRYCSSSILREKHDVRRLVTIQIMTKHLCVIGRQPRRMHRPCVLRHAHAISQHFCCKLSSPSIFFRSEGTMTMRRVPIQYLVNGKTKQQYSPPLFFKRKDTWYHLQSMSQRIASKGAPTPPLRLDDHRDQSSTKI